MNRLRLRAIMLSQAKRPPPPRCQMQHESPCLGCDALRKRVGIYVPRGAPVPRNRWFVDDILQRKARSGGTT